MNQKCLLSAKDVSEKLSVGRSTVYAYAESGILPPIILPSARPSKAKSRNRKAIRFAVADVEKFIHNLSRVVSKERGINVYQNETN